MMSFTLTLEQRVRNLIGMHLAEEFCEIEIDKKLEEMTVANLLHYISIALEPKP